MEIKCTLLLLFAFSFSSLRAQEADFEFINPPITIVVLGSSTAEGIGTSPRENAWVNRYRAYIQVFNPNNEVINLGKGGFDTYNILSTDSVYARNRPVPDTTRNFTKALQYKPDGIIINLPSNDVANGYSIEEQLTNFRYLSELSAVNGIELWVATTQARNFPRERDRQLQHDLKDSLISIFPNNYIDFWSEFCDEEFRLLKVHDSGDGCHLNNDAHKILTDRVIESKAFAGKLDASGIKREVSIELQEEKPSYMLTVGFSGGFFIDSTLQGSSSTVKIIQSKHLINTSEAINDSYKIEALVDVRVPVEVVFESDYCLTKVIEFDLKKIINYEVPKVYYPVELLDIEEITLDLFNYHFALDRVTVARFDFDTSTLTVKLDLDFSIDQRQRIVDAMLNPPARGKKVVTRWENDKKKSVLKFKNGQLSRKSKWYSENGNKKRVVHFRNGQYHGKYIEFNTEGKKKRIRFYEYDKETQEQITFDVQ